MKESATMRQLNSLDLGEARGALPMVIAHGLLGTARNWNSIARKLIDGHQVYCLDMRNHGQSFHDPRMDYPAMADDMASFITEKCAGRALVMGHSMGGKAAMTLALTQPDTVAGLVVVDMAPRRYDHDYGPMLSGMQAIDLPAMKSRSEVQKYVAPLAEGDPGLTQFLLQNLAREEDCFFWRPNLPVLERSMPEILDFPALTQDPKPTYDGPVLFIHGGASKYLKQERDAETIRSFFPKAEIKAVPDAGHWVHAQKPEVLLGFLKDWLAQNALG